MEMYGNDVRWGCMLLSVSTDSSVLDIVSTEVCR